MAALDSSAHYDGPFRRADGHDADADAGDDTFRRLIDRSPDGIIVHKDGRIVYVNATAVRLIGAQYADQVRGQLISAFMHPDSLASALTRLASLRNEGDVTRPSESIVVRLDGTTLDVEAVTALTTWGGAPAYHVTIRDLTYLRTAHRSLSEQAALVERLGVAIIATTSTGLVTKWNHAAETIYRRPAANALALPISAVVGAQLDPAAVVDDGGVVAGTHYASDGQPLLVEVSVTALGTGFALVVTDETKSHGSERLLRKIVESLDEGILVMDGAGGIVSANPAAEKIIGLSETELMAGHGGALHAIPMYDVDRCPIPLAENPVAQTLRTGRPFQGYVLGIDRSDGRRIWLRTSCRRLDTDDGYAPATLVSFSDITAERVARERLTYRATHDTLTGLPNRLVILNQISDSVRAQGDLRLGAVLFIDLDNLKAINDSLGHDSGDELLQSVGHCLRVSVGANDVVGRLGGDEFVTLVIGDVGPAELAEFVGRLEQSLSEPMELGAATVRTQASIGMTVVKPDDPRSPVEILSDADSAMYETKAKRRLLSHRIAVAVPDASPQPNSERPVHREATRLPDRDVVSGDEIVRHPRRF